MEVRKFNIYRQYLVEIDDVRPMGMGASTETWSWEISFAQHEDEHKGMAIERSRNAKISWTTLNEMVLDDEMIELCKRHMTRQ